MVDYQYLRHTQRRTQCVLSDRGSWISVDRGFGDCELYDDETFAPNDDSILEELLKGSHSTTYIFVLKKMGSSGWGQRGWWTLSIWGTHEGGQKVFYRTKEVGLQRTGAPAIVNSMMMKQLHQMTTVYSRNY
ncbi:hypothetical protein FH972_015443 [Carpinus fangiana]|uniref:Uncharacterized protein n=1 Tax=Carpinus fangiana TaxID=176857 RepID=A0A5N6RFJ3_9ROSI|nr:hypothetical protein FH972_015443 [Carpinus fangiana]